MFGPVMRPGDAPARADRTINPADLIITAQLLLLFLTVDTVPVALSLAVERTESWRLALVRHCPTICFAIARIEDLRNAVYGAGLEATQMSTALPSGNLTFARRDDFLYSSGLINGQVARQGPLSSDQLTMGVGLRMGAGTRHWLEETASGAVGVFHGSDEHDAFYTRGSLYATATLSLNRLEEIAAGEELVLDRPVNYETPLGTEALGFE